MPSSKQPQHTTTSYEEYLKNIKLNLSLNFDLDALTDEQLKNLKDLSNAYRLNASNSQVLVDAFMKLALQTVAAKMSTETRQIVGFQLKDLVSSCIMNGESCDMVNDFKQTFDVDYGNCYTFNHGTPIKYTTKRAGSAYGLRMTVISNSTESLPFSSEQGFKKVVHNQDLAPFPNAEGYKSAVGQAASMLLTRSKYSRLGEPYGKCSTRNSIAKNKQPFYYNGTYSTEGCFRSCFQRNIATACGCYDHRFPPPTDMNVPICNPLEPAKYKCMEEYIEKNGDYYFVDNCRCYDPCEDTAYRSYVFESPWPAGDFFYGGYCPMAKKMNVPCSEFYRNNGMKLEVSYAQLGYRAVEEKPLSTPWSLFNELAGNIGFWVGYTMLSFAEWILITVQVCLYTFGKELPEVPSLRHLDYSTEEEEESDDSSGEDAEETNSNSGSPAPSESSDDPEGVCVMPSATSMRHRTPPKNFDNVIGDTALTRREVEAIMPTNEEFYDAKDYELVVPVIAQTNEHAVRDAQD
ncbi:degenerin unc-8 [Aphelenchoides avenae]|nr:degenerin unc-8 [Aphelenchus avenae]